MGMMMNGGQTYDERDYVRSVADRLREAPRGGRGPIIEAAASLLGISKQALYQKLRTVGWSSKRKLRTDRGDSEVTRDEVMAVAQIMRSSRRATGKVLLPVQDAIEMALANDKLSRRVAPATMLRLMRLHKCHPAQQVAATPHTRMRSLHPNHVWQLDASICVLYYLRSGAMSVMDERKFNQRKPRDLARIVNERVLRYAVTDHTSGAVYARYYLTAGEDQATLFDFLMRAFQRRPEGLMFGVPLMLVWDAGSANQSHGIRNLLTGLIVRHWAHKPGSPRAKGQVEVTHNIIERKFEGRLAFMRVASIDELNAHLDTWLRDFNGNAIHSRHGSTRWAVWQQIRQEQLRICPPQDICRELLLTKPQERTVQGDLSIEFTCRGYPPARYSVAHVPGVEVKGKVRVTYNPYLLPNVFVVMEDEYGVPRHYECTPHAEARWGMEIDNPVFGESYRAKADTLVDIARKEMDEATYGERDPIDAMNAKAKGRVAFNGAIDPFKDVRERAAQVPAYIQRRGTELHVPNPVQTELKPLSHVDALFELRARLGRTLTTDEAARVAQLHPDGVPLEALEALVEAIANPTPDDVYERPRLVAVK
jgi:transposase InsO family protein